VSQPTLTERLGIVGSGQIACGLAGLAAPLGNVVLWARSDESAERARERLGDGPNVVTDLQGLSRATFVVEAVIEDTEAKADVLGRLHDLLDPGAILATTTSSLSISDLARASGRPDRFAGLHVFNPVSKMELVEVAFPEQASGDTRSRARALCEALGKTVVEVPDMPGFVVNRLLFPFLFDAVVLLEQTGLEPAAIDDCMRLGAGHPMGPLRLLDFVGLDVAVAIGDSLHADSGRQSDDVPERLRVLVAEGKLGRKSGAGFYKYDG
jgi:3-hydroxyacyl-CoA dehydrogenase